MYSLKSEDHVGKKAHSKSALGSYGMPDNPKFRAVGESASGIIKRYQAQ